MQELAAKFSEFDDVRMNDGKTASDGSFWVGSMQNNIAEDGRSLDIKSNIIVLFRIDGSGEVSPLIAESLGIYNTLAWSIDFQTFYYLDSMKGCIYGATLLDDGSPKSSRITNDSFNRGVQLNANVYR